MCKPSAIRAMEPNSAPPMISRAMMAPQIQITSQVRRSACSCRALRKM
jgi:hypothetical protein